MQLRYLVVLAMAGLATAALSAITVSEEADEGQRSWKIVTQNATYFYHIEGAGFSSILDRHGNDWIDYHPWGGSEGMHRGIPNMVFGEGGSFFHPGHSGEKGSVSTLERTDSKVSITSVSKDGLWEVLWEITDSHATMTVVKAAGNYWFLYEGTPGGGYDVDLDWYLLPDGTRNPVGEDAVGDIPGPEWVVFGEKGLDTVFFLAHHRDDSISDTYMHWWNMTVFGFGRAGRDDFEPKMSAENEVFSIGFLENADADILKSNIEKILRLPESASRLSPAAGPDVYDVDGNRYETVVIGSQTWMTENLRTTHFNDGTPIPQVTDAEKWAATRLPAFCWPASDRKDEEQLSGAFYNGYAIRSGKLCPEGWRVPTDEDWKLLERAVGMSQETVDSPDWRGSAGGSLAGGRELWVPGALRDAADFNTSGFEGLPAGNRIGKSGTIGNRGSNAYWWSSTIREDEALARNLFYGSLHVIRTWYDLSYGMCVRCVKDD